MSTQTAIHTAKAARIDKINVRVIGMVFAGTSSMALSFYGDDSSGLEVSFQGSTDEMRVFASELVRHADVTDAFKPDAGTYSPGVEA